MGRQIIGWVGKISGWVGRLADGSADWRMGRQIGGWVMGMQISGSMGRSVPIDPSSRMRSSLFKISAVARFRVLAGPGVAHYSLQNLRNLEYGAILNARDARTKFREARDDFIDAVVNVLEGIEHDAGAVLL